MGKKAAKKRAKKVTKRKIPKRIVKKLLEPTLELLPPPVLVTLPTAPEGSVIAYKGFDQDLRCRKHQYEVGKSYEHHGRVERCSSGFHSCEHPLDVFGYYPPASSRYARVTASGELSRETSGDTKIASGRISIDVELKVPDLVAMAVQYVFNRAKWTGAASATSYSGAASATGVRGAASATGVSGAASATGYSGAASATGDRGAASATSYSGAASATGDRGAASATGDRGAASATGYRGAASATGKHSVALAAGPACKARSAETGAIICVYREWDGSEYVIKHIRASKVGENGIKPDTWYTLDEHGQFQEVPA